MQDKFFRNVDGVQHFIPVEERLTEAELGLYYTGMIEWKQEQMTAMYKRRDGRRERQAAALIRGDIATMQVLRNAVESDDQSLSHLADEIQRLRKEEVKYPLAEFPQDK